MMNDCSQLRAMARAVHAYGSNVREKMMVKLPMAATVLAAAACVASCSQAGSAGSDTVVVSEYSGALNYREVKHLGRVERDMKVAHFDALCVSGAVDVTFVQADSCRLVISGDEKDIDRYDVEQEQGTLHLKSRRKASNSLIGKHDVKAIVYAPSLERIHISGAGNLEVPDAVRMDGALDIKVSGAGDIEMRDLSVSALQVTLSGAADVDLDQVDVQGDAHVNMSGAGDAEMNVKAHNVYASVSGAGDLDLTVDCNILECRVSGAGDVDVRGKCRTLRPGKSGAGDLNTGKLKVTGE